MKIMRVLLLIMGIVNLSFALSNIVVRDVNWNTYFSGFTAILCFFVSELINKENK